MSRPKKRPGMVARPVLDRIVEKLSLGSDCWTWEGHVDIGGYGTITVGSRVDGSRHAVKVHRALYELLVGPVPTGLDLDHLCRNRPCCNPDHLEPVTRRENVLRGQTIPAANAGKTHCLQGHPFDARNTGRDKTTGARICRECRAEQQRRRRASRRAA